MTTPSDNSAYGIITDAARDAQKIQLNQNLNAELLAEGMRRLRDLILYFQTKGLKLWLQEDTAVPLTAGTATYTFAPAGSVVMTRPFRALQGYYLYTATNTRRPIYPMSWQEYLTLGQAGTLTSNRGVISQYLVDKQATQLSVTFWLCPDTTEAANGQAHLLLQTQAAGPIELDETLEFPNEWRLALRWALADDWSTGQPQAIVERCQQKSEMYRIALEDWDVEDASTSIQPDMRGQGSRSFV